MNATARVRCGVVELGVWYAMTLRPFPADAPWEAEARATGVLGDGRLLVEVAPGRGPYAVPLAPAAFLGLRRLQSPSPRPPRRRPSWNRPPAYEATE